MKIKPNFILNITLFAVVSFLTLTLFQNCAKIDYSDEATGPVTGLSSFQISDLDSDGDGLSDSIENEMGTDISVVDSDGDGLSDGAEVNVHHSNPLDPDTDAGGVSDGTEVEQGKDPNDKSDDSSCHTSGDRDRDGLTDQKESLIGTDPNNPDTDGDGLKDGAEHFTYRTNPRDADSDDGGVKDGEEVAQGNNPLLASDDLKIICQVGSGRCKDRQYQCPAHQRHCNNGSGNGSESCSPSANGNWDE